MTIRPAKEQDIPAIVGLLKLSLGESLMPKSEAFWRWKHIDNPFGKSPVLLAKENDKLIGVRAFMRWEWRQGDRIYKSVRAVDTATHPDHQGKGIFKKLTLQLVEQCKSEGIDFIFNTPNKSSKPGYLKMGWGSNGRLRLQLRPVLWRVEKAPDFEFTYALKAKVEDHEKFNTTEGSLMTTSLSAKFINWRYQENPNIKYYSFSDNEHSPSYLTIFRLKPYRFGTEFRICDTLRTTGFDLGKYRKHFHHVLSASGAKMVTASMHLNIFPTVTIPVGPEITTLPLSFNHNFLTFNFWKPSLGDLEVF
jgi:GNAT superfamily N-acetyltransferase